MSCESATKYSFGGVTKNFDNLRIPLSSREREKKKGPYPYYGAQGIIDSLDDYIFDGQYLLIAEDGENLKSKKQNIAQLVEGKFWVNNHAHIVKNNQLSDIRYLYYYINNVDISGYITGSAQPKLNQANLNKICVSLPPLLKQKKIADLLSSLDDKIELNNQINANLEKQAQAIFKSWFIDFEPFKDGGFVESELGLIPKGWKVGCIGDYCKVRSGFAFKSTWWQNKGLKVIKIKNIENGLLNLNDCSYVAEEKAVLASDFIVKNGDMLIAMTGATLGKYTMVFDNNETLLVNQRVGKFFIGDKPVKRLPFIYGILKQENIINQIINKGQGSAQSNISSSDIENVKIVIPEKSISDIFNSSVSKFYSLIINNINQSTKLATIRDTLLPKLMSGEIENLKHLNPHALHRNQL
jgi:type I restriction enzyme, S subunit